MGCMTLNTSSGTLKVSTNYNSVARVHAAAEVVKPAGNRRSRYRAAGARIRDGAAGGHPAELWNSVLSHNVQRQFERCACCRSSLDRGRKLGEACNCQPSGGFGLDRPAPERHDLMLRSPLGRVARTVNMVQLGKVLTELRDPRVNSLFVYNSNPAAVCSGNTTG